MRNAHWYISTYVQKVRHGQKLSAMDIFGSDMETSDMDHLLYPTWTVNDPYASEKVCPCQITFHGGCVFSMADIKCPCWIRNPTRVNLETWGPPRSIREFRVLPTLCVINQEPSWHVVTLITIELNSTPLAERRDEVVHSTNRHDHRT